MASEDWYHLWELEAALGSLPQQPSRAPVRDTARRALANLLRGGYLYAADVSFAENREAPVPAGEAIERLASPEPWAPKEAGPHLSFAVTAKGRAALAR